MALVLKKLSGIEAIQAGLGAASLALMAPNAVMATKALISPNMSSGINGIEMDIKLTENISHTAQVTDHYTEDNSAIQDHVAFEPIKITLTGKVGELVYRSNAALAFAQATIDRLTPVNAITPTMAASGTKAIADAYQAQALAYLLYRVTQQALQPLTKNLSQKTIYDKFHEIFYSRTLNTVETPWRTYDNMLLESWTADQDESTTMETTFTLNFKQIRLIRTTENVGLLAGRVDAQLAPVTSKGTASTGASAAYKWLTPGVP